MSVWKIDDKICVVFIIVDNKYNVHTVLLDSQDHPSNKDQYLVYLGSFLTVCMLQQDSIRLWEIGIKILVE